MKKISILFHIIVICSCLINCNKTKKMKDKLFPDRSYDKANIDKFYWSDSGWDYSMIPLIKPIQLLQLQGDNKWEISTGFNNSNEIGISDITKFNIIQSYIYGYKAPEIHESDSNFNLPEYWFIIDTRKGVKIEDSALVKFNKESDFKIELIKLNLPEQFLNPDEIYEQYKNDPVLPWFPEDVKKQLEEVKAKK